MPMHTFAESAALKLPFNSGNKSQQYGRDSANTSQFRRQSLPTALVCGWKEREKYRQPTLNPQEPEPQEADEGNYETAAIQSRGC